MYIAEAGGVRKWDFYSPLPPFRSPTVDMGVRRRSASVEAVRGLGMGKQVLVLIEGLLIFNLFCKKFGYFLFLKTLVTKDLRHQRLLFFCDNFFLSPSLFPFASVKRGSPKQGRKKKGFPPLSLIPHILLMAERHY